MCVPNIGDAGLISVVPALPLIGGVDGYITDCNPEDVNSSFVEGHTPGAEDGDSSVVFGTPVPPGSLLVALTAVLNSVPARGELAEITVSCDVGNICVKPGGGDVASLEGSQVG